MLLQHAQTIPSPAAASIPGPFSFIQHLLGQWSLIARLTRREVESRYKGSFLGVAWAAVIPLLMLAVYTFIFSVVFHARWQTADDNKAAFAMVLFLGLILFNLFAECLVRAPTLMLSHVSYVKKVVFPLEVLPLVVLGSALFNAGVSFAVWLAGYFLLIGVPPVTLLALPLILLPLLFFSLGASLFLASFGVFVRDLQQVMGVATSILLFLSPIFYPLSAIPQKLQMWIHLNPLTVVIECARDAAFSGTLGPVALLAACILLSYAGAWAGFWWFMKTKKAFADVL